MKKNSGLSFFSALVPGCGQMYQGYFKRGISIISWFFGIIIISGLLNLGVLSILLLPIWLFSFFDSYSLRNLTAQQRVLFPDDFIPPSQWSKKNISAKNIFGSSSKIIGWGLIILGAMFIYSNILLPLLHNVPNLSPFINDFLSQLPDLLIAGAIIFAGAWLLVGRKKIGQEQDVPNAETEEAKISFIKMPPAAFVAAQQQTVNYVQYPQAPYSAPQTQNQPPAGNQPAHQEAPENK